MPRTRMLSRGGQGLRRIYEFIIQRKKRFVAAFVVFAHILGALSSIKAVMETRTAQGAVAWVVSLNTMPYVAVPAYWVFGDSDFQGYVTARRSHRQEIKDLWDQYHAVLREKNLLARSAEQSPFVAEELAKLPLTEGNHAELLIDGEATFESIFEGISQAKKYVCVQFYIVQDDEVGRELAERLIERARAGVACYFLYDEIGSRLPDSYLRPLREAGVAVRPFNTTQGDANRFQLNFRNHRKIVITDGREAWVGGLNVGREYLGLGEKMGYWRDTHVKVSGPVVQSVQVSFAEDWHWAAQERLTGLVWEPEAAENGASMRMMCLPSGPVDPLETCTLFFLNAINGARERLWIASPYFVPDEQFISALQLAKLRGVDVRIIIPEKADNALVNLSAWSYLPDLQKVGIEVYRYEKGFMHHKVMVVDERYATIGTANFDNRSFRLNFEITMAVDDAAFTAQVSEMMEDDMAESRLVEPGAFDDKSAWFRFWSKAARLSAPVQ